MPRVLLLFSAALRQRLPGQALWLPVEAPLVLPMALAALLRASRHPRQPSPCVGGGVVQRMEENHQDASQEDAAEAKEAAAKEKADRAEKKQQAKEEAKKETLYKLMR